jgi:hypothetical protein
LRKAFAGLVKSVQGALDALIYLGVVVLPWLVVVGLVAFVVRRVLRRYRARRVADDASFPSSGEG